MVLLLSHNNEKWTDAVSDIIGAMTETHQGCAEDHHVPVDLCCDLNLLVVILDHFFLEAIILLWILSSLSSIQFSSAWADVIKSNIFLFHPTYLTDTSLMDSNLSYVHGVDFGDGCKNRSFSVELTDV